jgi:hypothetical protein
VSPEEELELREKQKNFVPKLVLTLHETDNRLNFELFVGTEFPLVENARVFVSPKKIRDDEFFKSLKALTNACQKLIEKREQKEKS